MLDSATPPALALPARSARSAHATPAARIGIAALVLLVFAVTILSTREVLPKAWASLAVTWNTLRAARQPSSVDIPAPRLPAPLTVGVAPVELRRLGQVMLGDGSVVAWQEMVLGAEAGGLRVAEVMAEEGDRVIAGQVLLRFDDRLQVALAAQAEAAVSEAEAALQVARTELARASALARDAITSRQVVETRQGALLQAEARLAAAHARRDEAAARLAQTRILAPAAGIVARRAVTLGSVPAPGQEVYRIIQDGRLELAAKVPELALRTVGQGQRVRVRHGEYLTEGSVRAIAPIVDTTTRLGIVYITLQGESGLRPGMFAHAEIAVEPRQVVAVPEQAVAMRGGVPVAFVLGADARISARQVEVGMRHDGFVEIRAGLHPDESVVTSGLGFLVDGTPARAAVHAGDVQQ
jgi:RND family efflux transporter MFP subunit